MLAWLLITLLVAPDRPRPDDTHARHIRPLSNIARATIAEAARRSQTVTDMLDELERLDVIVYVNVDFPLTRVRAGTTLQSGANGFRFLTVSLDVTLDPMRRMEMLGHELQHALEIARTDVGDDAGLRRLFGTIGWDVGERSYETREAITVEQKVRRELVAPRPKTQLLP